MDTTRRIREKLKLLDKEVQDVHPLLDMLFSKMDRIIRYEYKQGPSENGADFVLVKQDDILDVEEYIGVVVKKDGITKNSHDVNRQIEECITTPRTIDGRKGIMLDEVWVITPGNITQNAQEFFLNKYKSTKIKFIAANKLADLIEKYIPAYFQGIPLNVNNYLIKTKESLLNIEKNSQLTFHSLGEVSVEQDLIPNDRMKYKDDDRATRRRAPSKTNIIKVLEKKSSILIEGGMGSGKSTLLRNTAKEMLNPEEFEKNNRLPIYITFKELGEKFNFSIESLIIERLREIAEDLQYVIFLDGIDESNHDLRERLKYIDNIIEYTDSQPNISLVMTSRNLDENTFKTKISHTFKSFEIAPLSLRQIIKVLEQTCKSLNLKNRIIEDLKKSTMYKKLPKTPIAAILLARLINDNQHDIPSNLTELYSKYTELALGRWDVSKELNTDKEYSICNSVTKRIAHHFIKHDLIQISIQEALYFFEEYLKERNLGLEPKVVFDRLLKRCELFYVDENANSFGFKHRTFVEYFYAQNLLDNGGTKITEDSFELYWATINFFWIGLKKDCPEELLLFSDVVPSHDRTKLLKLVNLGNLLLAGYESPNQTIQYAIKNIFIEAATLLTELIDKKVESRLSAFSEMHLTCIFRHIMSDSYGYEFFSDAIDNAMLSISSDPSIDKRIAATSLFFLNTAQALPIIENLFDNVANTNLIGHAPLSIQLAIEHEAKDRNIHNAHIKKVKRNLKKVVSDRATIAQMKILYERPLNKMNLK
ncbi:MAG: energy-coupling factor transporter ATP-binding protein EcfA2 [Oleiphilaceae bacterium]|jgi:energy-coupling factor transporter ATP-binding protein EcfA2